MILIQAIKNEDDRQFIEDIYEQYKPWMMFRANKIIDNIDTCEELVHDCMVNLIKHIETLRRLTDAQRRSYIAVAVEHTALNFAKKSSKILMMNSYDSADLQFVEDKDNVETEVEKRLGMQAILDNLQYLPKRDRDLLKLKYELELSDTQISEIMDIKKDCVRMTVKRSVLKLQRKIEERRGL